MGQSSAVIGFLSLSFLFASTALADAAYKVTWDNTFEFFSGEDSYFDCRHVGGVMYIQTAEWKPTGQECNQKKNVLTQFREVCQYTERCDFVPDLTRSEGKYTHYGDLCNGKQMVLAGHAQCRDPCHHGPQCGVGHCSAVTDSTWKCTCADNFVNLRYVSTGECVRNLCTADKCSNGECSMSDDGNTFSCSCNIGHENASATSCRAYDMCREKDEHCPKHAICSDGMGRLPQCDCPPYHRVTENECKPFDMCGEIGACPDEAKCVDGWGKQQTCICPKYHQFANGVCEAVDQCTIDRGSCDTKGRCIEGVGQKPKCICQKGYSLGLDKKTCVDINECQKHTGQCTENEICVNKIGGYECRCKNGFVHKDGLVGGMCLPHKCASGPCKKHGKCIVSDDGTGYKCACNTGYKFEDGTCIAKDLCETGNGGCPLGGTCTDGVGKVPTCDCPNGLTLPPSGCVSVDLCHKNHGGCPVTASCTEGVGTEEAQCLCPRFYSRDGAHCKAVDQCDVAHNRCGPRSTCSEGLGRPPRCTCEEYWEMDRNNKCVDINECLVDNGGCGEIKTCVNKIGEPHECVCDKQGYGLDRENRCLKIGSFILPKEGVIKVTSRNITGTFIVRLGSRFSVTVRPKLGRVILRPTCSKLPMSKRMRRSYVTSDIIVLLHRQGKRLGSYVYTGEGADFGVDPVYIASKWDAKYIIDTITIEGAKGESRIYRTNNIYSEVRNPSNNPVNLPSEVGDPTSNPVNLPSEAGKSANNPVRLPRLKRLPHKLSGLMTK